MRKNKTNKITIIHLTIEMGSTLYSQQMRSIDDMFFMEAQCVEEEALINYWVYSSEVLYNVLYSLSGILLCVNY